MMETVLFFQPRTNYKRRIKTEEKSETHTETGCIVVGLPVILLHRPRMDVCILSVPSERAVAS